MRWFRRKKKEEEAEATVESPEETQGPSPSSTRSVVRVTQQIPESPSEAFIQRLNGFITDSEIVEKTKALKSTKIQMIVGGTPLLLSKEGVKPMMLSRERTVTSDVFIRLSDEAAGQLATTKTPDEFKTLYKDMIKTKGTSSYVSIKFHTPLDELRRLGYFTIELLRTLIDA